MSKAAQFTLTYRDLCKSRSKCLVCDKPLFAPLERCSKMGHYSTVVNMRYVDGLVEVYDLTEYYQFDGIYVMINYQKAITQISGMDRPLVLVRQYLDANGFVTLEGIKQLIHKASLFQHLK